MVEGSKVLATNLQACHCARTQSQQLSRYTQLVPLVPHLGVSEVDGPVLVGYVQVVDVHQGAVGLDGGVGGHLRGGPGRGAQEVLRDARMRCNALPNVRWGYVA